jgi:DNA-binding transcriptional LysR family regulator
MNLASIDLNLLVVFEALYETRSVTLAGQRLNRAQPSVSNALARLRSLFEDELFVRTAEGMAPTEQAVALMPAIDLALEQIRRALAQGVGFDPAAARGRRFTLAASDYADVVIIPHLVARLRREAPEVDLRVKALDRAAIYGQLDHGSVDLAIGGHLAPPKRMQVEPLYEERFVCIADRRHPLLRGRALDLDAYLRLPHALFVPSDDGSTRGVIDVRLDRLGHRRRVAATFAHIVALPYAVLGTDLIASLAGRAAERLAPKGIALHPLPAELGDTSFRIEMVHSRRAQGDAAVAWLRRAVLAAVQAMPSGI